MEERDRIGTEPIRPWPGNSYVSGYRCPAAEDIAVTDQSTRESEESDAQQAQPTMAPAGPLDVPIAPSGTRSCSRDC